MNFIDKLIADEERTWLCLVLALIGCLSIILAYSTQRRTSSRNQQRIDAPGDSPIYHNSRVITR
jgi:hypothetical protein